MEHEEELRLSDAQMARVQALAERLGITVDEVGTMALEAGVTAKYVLPKSGGGVTQLHSPKRDRP